MQRLRAAPGQRSLCRNRAKTNIRQRERQQRNFMISNNGNIGNNGNNGNNLNSEILGIQHGRRNEVERRNMRKRQREREEFIEASRQRNKQWVEEKLKSPQSIRSANLGFDENGNIFGFEALHQEYERMLAKLDNMDTMKQFMILHRPQSREN